MLNEVGEYDSDEKKARFLISIVLLNDRVIYIQ